MSHVLIEPDTVLDSGLDHGNVLVGDDRQEPGALWHGVLCHHNGLVAARGVLAVRERLRTQIIEILLVSDGADSLCGRGVPRACLRRISRFRMLASCGRTANDKFARASRCAGRKRICCHGLGGIAANCDGKRFTMAASAACGRDR